MFDEPLAKMAKLQRSAKSPSPEEASTSAPPILEAKNSERYYENSDNSTKHCQIPLTLRGVLVRECENIPGMLAKYWEKCTC